MGNRLTTLAFGLLVVGTAGCGAPERAEVIRTPTPGYDDDEPPRVGDPYPERLHSLEVDWEQKR